MEWKTIKCGNPHHSILSGYSLYIDERALSRAIRSTAVVPRDLIGLLVARSARNTFMRSLLRIRVTMSNSGLSRQEDLAE